MGGTARAAALLLLAAIAGACAAPGAAVDRRRHELDVMDVLLLRIDICRIELEGALQAREAGDALRYEAVRRSLATRMEELEGTLRRVQAGDPAFTEPDLEEKFAHQVLVDVGLLRSRAAALR
jgi:hypothetical protein